MAERVFNVLMKLESCKTFVMQGLVTSLENAGTYASAKELTKRLVGAQRHLSHDQVRRLLHAAVTNSQVSEASFVPEQIKAIAKAAGIPIPEANDDIPF